MTLPGVHSVQAKAWSLAWQFSLCLVGLAIFVMAIKRSKVDATAYVSLGSDRHSLQTKQNAELQEIAPLNGPEHA